MISNSGTLLLQHRNGDYYKAQDQSVAFIVEPCLCVPIFCLKRSEQAKISIAEREKLRKQFPNHTHALIIEDEHAFLKNIQSSFDENAFCHEIFYQDKFFTDYLEFLLSGQSDITFNVPAATARYYAEIYMVPDDHNKSTVRFRIDDLLYIAFQRCSSTVKKQHTDTDFRAVLAALFSFVQVAVFEPIFL